MSPSADLIRLLELDPAAVVEPLEPPHLRLTLVPGEQPMDELIRVALTNRPELAGQQALVQASLERLRQEKWRPLVPSVLVRGFSTPVTGTRRCRRVRAVGLRADLNNFGGRLDLDVQLIWQLQNLGLGNRALVRQRRAENGAALVELRRTMDQVAADVATASGTSKIGSGLCYRGGRGATPSNRRKRTWRGRTRPRRRATSCSWWCVPWR